MDFNAFRTGAEAERALTRQVAKHFGHNVSALVRSTERLGAGQELIRYPAVGMAEIWFPVTALKTLNLNQLVVPAKFASSSLVATFLYGESIWQKASGRAFGLMPGFVMPIRLKGNLVWVMLRGLPDCRRYPGGLFVQHPPSGFHMLPLVSYLQTEHPLPVD